MALGPSLIAVRKAHRRWKSNSRTGAHLSWSSSSAPAPAVSRRCGACGTSTTPAAIIGRLWSQARACSIPRARQRQRPTARSAPCRLADALRDGPRRRRRLLHMEQAAPFTTRSATAHMPVFMPATIPAPVARVTTWASRAGCSDIRTRALVRRRGCTRGCRRARHPMTTVITLWFAAWAQVSAWRARR